MLKTTYSEVTNDKISVHMLCISIVFPVNSSKSIDSKKETESITKYTSKEKTKIIITIIIIIIIIKLIIIIIVIIIMIIMMMIIMIIIMLSGLFMDFIIISGLQTYQNQWHCTE